MDFPEFSFGLGNEYDPVLRTSMIISNGRMNEEWVLEFEIKKPVQVNTNDKTPPNPVDL